MRTEVCAGEVVAPPISSGSVNPWRCISSRDVHHLVERRGDQTRQSDHVGALAPRGLEDLLARHHDAEIDHLEVIALEHHADDVLADVVHVALDRGHHDAAVAACAPPPAAFSFSM